MNAAPSIAEVLQEFERGEFPVSELAERVHPRLEAGDGGRPETLGGYRLLRHLAGGGMGMVLLARHEDERVAERQRGDVAFKLLRPRFLDDEEARGRFVREAELGLRLDHDGIVRVFELVSFGEGLATVMELAEGQELAHRIGRETGPIPWIRAKPLFEQLVEAVAHLHDNDVVHRDLKPGNVVVCAVGSQPSVKLLDLGIAKSGRAGLTAVGAGMGTLNYVAPEQARDAATVDGRADVYALAMTLYEMLAGRLPWEVTDSPVQILRRKMEGDLPPPSSLYPGVPPELEAVIGRGLAVGPEYRYQTARELSGAFSQATEALQERARAGALPEPVPDAARVALWAALVEAGSEDAGSAGPQAVATAGLPVVPSATWLQRRPPVVALRLGAAVIAAVAVLGAVWTLWPRSSDRVTVENPPADETDGPTLVAPPSGSSVPGLALEAEPIADRPVVLEADPSGRVDSTLGPPAAGSSRDHARFPANMEAEMITGLRGLEREFGWDPWVRKVDYHEGTGRIHIELVASRTQYAYAFARAMDALPMFKGKSVEEPRDADSDGGVFKLLTRRHDR